MPGDRNHWVLLMFEEKSSTITYVNPKGEKSSTISSLERRWNQFSSYQFLSEKSKKLYKWKVITKSHFKQRDTSSCGVFVMRFAESLLLNEALPEEMKQIYELRQRMAEKLIELSDPLGTYCHACGWEDGGVWVQCDECDWWYHLPCVNKKLKKMCVADEDAERIKFTGPCCTTDGNYRVQL
ncbi:uncharacterized protein [Dysidea avara]|uniref:uncharacterized protein n=1 Tax=Dysidea avara TaxID=196820 RepID=UPI003318C0C0